MKLISMVLAMGIVVLLVLAPAASAQVIRFTPQACILVLTPISGEGEPVELDIYEIGYLGTTEAGVSYVLRDGTIFTTSHPVFDTIEGGGMAEMVTYQSGETLDEILPIQQSLIDLGYLTGTADGSFGPMTYNALSKLQGEYGLGRTGTADPLTQRLIAHLASEGQASVNVQYPPLPETKFAPVFARVEGDLTPLCADDFIFLYDDMTDAGSIRMAGSFTHDAEAATAIDQRSYTIEWGFALLSTDDGKLALQPQLLLTTRGTRRPFARSLILRAGDALATLPIAESASDIDTSSIIERDAINLTPDDLATLAQIASSDAAKLRVEGKYENADFLLTGEALTHMMRFIEASQLAAGL